MAFFTGKGDSGTTKLFDSPKGVRVSKSSPIFECLGQLDELSAVVGWCRIACPADLQVIEVRAKDLLHDVQNHLFTLLAEAAGAGKSVPQSSVEKLGALINAIECELPETNTFLALGATELSARLDIARAISRRVERRLVALHESGERMISESSRAYANRLSSFLYALARLVNHKAGAEEQSPQYKSE